jgi:hypothetical protein
MSISDRLMQCRAPESLHEKVRELMKLFERDRSWVMRKAMETLWTLMFEPNKLVEFFNEWQAFKGTTSQYRVTQLRLAFTDMEPSFFPKINGGLR